MNNVFALSVMSVLSFFLLCSCGGAEVGALDARSEQASTLEPDNNTPTRPTPSSGTHNSSPSVTCTDKTWVSGSAYTVSMRVKNRGSEYECLVAGWCSSDADWAYEPGSGLYWSEAWSKRASCTNNNAGENTNTDGTSLESAPEAVSTVIAVPSAALDRIGVSWVDNSNTETLFKISRSVNGEDFIVVQNLASNTVSYIDENVNQGNQYQYQIVALGRSTQSRPTSSNTVTLDLVINAATRPSQLLAVNNNGAALLTWRNPSIAQFQLRLSRSEDELNWQQIAQLNSRAERYRDSSVQVGVSYSYRIHAFNDEVESDFSNTAHFLNSSARLAGEILFEATCTRCHKEAGLGPDLFSSQIKANWKSKQFTDLLDKTQSMLVEACDADCVETITDYIWVNRWGFQREVIKAGKVAAGVRGIRLLTPTEYRQTISDLFSINVPEIDLPKARFDADFKYPTHSKLGIVRQDNVREFMLLAEQIAQQVSLAKMGCEQSQCSRSHVAALGLRVFRRTLSDAELERYVGYKNEHSEQAMLSAMLMSPYFLYLVETGAWDAESESYVLNDFELASHLSFRLWGASPDAELLNLAQSGQLHLPARLTEQVTRLINSERFANHMRTFIQHYTKTYAQLSEKPGLNHTIIDAMKQEQALAINHLFMTGSANIDELFNPSYSFLNSALASHYGIDNVSGSAFKKVHVSDVRGGILHQGLTQVHNSDFAATSLVKRGKMIRENMFCHYMGVPSGIDPDTINLPDHAISTRERWDLITGPTASEGQCWQCHQLMNEPGSALEHYDQAGRYRFQEPAFNNTESMIAIEASGVLRDNSGLNELTDYNSLRELTRYMSQSDEVRDCFVDNLYRFTMGHQRDTTADSGIEQLQAFFSLDGDIRLLVKELVLSELMLHRQNRD